jgi:hypothetical protein
VASVSGNQITVPLFVGFPGDPSRGSFTGGLIVRESDGALAFVTDTSTDQWGGRSTVTVTIAAQPSPAIAPNDVVHFRPSWGTPQAGHVDWTINGTNMFAFYNPMASAVYRDNQRHAAQLLFVHALGLLPADLTSWRDYTVACNAGNFPAGDDWPSVHSNSYSQAFWTNHWTTISQVPQIGSATPPTALTITRAARPEDTTALVDGWGPGLMPGETEASIRISGTATGGNGTAVQFRLVPHGGGTPIVDWTPIGTISNGAYAGTVTIPRSTGWCRLEVRSAANQSVTAAFGGRWALGRKVLVIGQSQVGIWNGDSQNWYAPMAGNADTGSVVSWQALGGSSENLRIIGAATTDGPQAFLDQWRAIDPDTPLFAIVDAVGGTSILQLLDDASGNRAWSDLTAKLDKYGTDVCVVIDNWGTSNNSPLSGLSGGGTVGDRFFNLVLGTNLHGSGADHDFADVLRAGFVWGHSPVTRHSHNGSMDGYRQSTVAAASARDIAVGPPVNDFPIHSGNSAHQAASYQSDGPERGTSVLGARMAIAGLRALGLDTSQNPSVNAAIRSADGTKITVTFNLPNGGSLYSNAPAALSQFLVSENGGTSWTKTSFTTAILGNTVELTKTSGVWVGTLSLRVRFESDPKVYTDPSNATTVVSSVQSFQQEIQAADGIVMESWAPCIFGWGLPVSGQVAGGVWTLPQTVTLIPGQG